MYPDGHAPASLASPMLDLRPGKPLKNGATLVAVRHLTDQESVVLAIVEGGSPYVTWRLSRRDGETYWGHYHRTLGEAFADFNAR